MVSTIRSITVDCAGPRQLAQFWAAALGYMLDEESDDEGAVVEGPVGSGPRLLFLRVPEGKSVKNRVHLDLRPAESMATEVERLTGLGARTLKVFSENAGDVFTVMQDPEGNEFCVERGPRDREARGGQ